MQNQTMEATWQEGLKILDTLPNKVHPPVSFPYDYYFNVTILIAHCQNGVFVVG